LHAEKFFEYGVNTLVSQSVAKHIKMGGVVGSGGAGFPTHAKLTQKVEILLANGAECEPLLQSDSFIMEKYPHEVLQGMRYIMKETGAKRGIIGIKEKNKEAIKKIKKAIEDYPEIEFSPLPNYYPMGDEHVLVERLTGRIIPEGGIPLEVGVVVNNVTTLYNVCRAVEGAPVTQRVVTITGDVNKPCIANVPLGTPIHELIRFANGASLEEYAVLIGGPMMGTVTYDFSVPVTKTTSAIIVLAKDHFLICNKTTPLSVQIRRAKAACCQCSYCSTLCPRNLLGHELYPHKIMRALSYGLDFPTGDVTGAVLCCHCGICGVYACVMGLEPSIINMEVKKQLAKAGWKNTVHRRKDLTPHPQARERMVPSERLLAKLNLEKYNVRLPFMGNIQVDKVSIPLRQHIGAAALPVVSVGNYVEIGDLIGEIPEKSLGARVHSSINGRVVKVGESVIIESAAN